MKVPFPVWLLGAFLVSPLAHGETQVVHGDPSKLPAPDMTRQFERKQADGFQKTFNAKSVPVGAVQTRAWSGASPAVTTRAWEGSTGDFYARSIQVGAFESRGSASPGWATRGQVFEQGTVATSSSPLDGRGEGMRPNAVAAEAVEIPPDLTPDDMGKKFRVTTPLVEVDASGRKRERGHATTEREVAPVRVGSQGSGGVRAPPGKPSPQTPAASK